RKVFIFHQVDRMGFPFCAFQIQENLELLRTRRKGEMKHVQTLPAVHLVGLHVHLRQFHHRSPPCPGKIASSLKPPKALTRCTVRTPSILKSPASARRRPSPT